jgi:regulator of sigma E protease
MIYSLLSHLSNLPAQVAEQAQATNPIVGTLIAVAAFVIMLLILVFVHELGHFAVAMWMKIRVDEFGIGYPPRAMTLFERNGVKYTLNWLPLGGFVRFAGEDDSLYGVGSLAEAKPWTKIPVMLAGPLMNLILAVIIFALMFITMGIPETIGQRIGTVFEETPAAEAGLQEGDILLTLDGQPVLSSDVVKEVGESNTGTPIPAVVMRDGERVSLTVTPGAWTSPEGTQYESGFGFGYMPEMEIVRVGVVEAVVTSFLQTGEILVRMAQGLAALIGGLFQVAEAPEGGVAGPIGIARATGEVIERGGVWGFLNWTALLSINLFVLNLLPIPALDGSHILFSLIEWVRGGKKVPPEKEALVHAIGFIALMGLILLVSVSDVINALQGQSVLGGG